MSEVSVPGVSASGVYAFVWRYWRRVPIKFALVVAGVFCAIAVEVQVPARSAELVVAAQAYVQGTAPLEAAESAAAWLVGFFATVFALKQAYFRVWMFLAAEVMQRMLGDGFARAQQFSTDWHTNHFAGSTQRVITRGMWAYDSLADITVIDLGPAFGLLIGFAVAMFLRDPLLGAYFATAVTVFLAISITLSVRYVAPANQRSNDADTAVGGALADAITCNPVIKAFGAEDRENLRFAGISRTWRLAARRAWSRSMDAGAVQSVMLLVLLAGLLAVVLHLSGREGARVEDVVYVITTYLMVNSYLRNIGGQIRNAQRAINELDDLVEISRTLPQVADAPDAHVLARPQGAIQFERVRFGYPGQPTPVFDGLDVTIAAGERIALVGESGSGKSTFVKLLQRLYDLDGGRIVIDGHDIAGVTQDSLRRAIALVPQDPILFHRTLGENIAYARPDAEAGAIVHAAREAHAHDFIARLEQGYDTLVGERGIKLSGGERQRVAIARAILADAPILVLDEATSSLDSVTEQHIQQALGGLMQARTSVIIAHRLSTVRNVDRVLVFDAGRIVEEGTHETLMRIEGGHYRRLVETQSFAASRAA